MFPITIILVLNILYLRHQSFVHEEALPVHIVVVEARVELRRLVDQLEVVLVVLDLDHRGLLEELAGDL